jgi:hypothetical protein
MTTKNSYPRGTVVYCWKFWLPITGWVGGHPSEFWSNDRSKIAMLAEHCDRKNLIIESVSDGSQYRQ